MKYIKKMKKRNTKKYKRRKSHRGGCIIYEPPFKIPPIGDIKGFELPEFKSTIKNIKKCK